MSLISFINFLLSLVQLYKFLLLGGEPLTPKKVQAEGE